MTRSLYALGALLLAVGLHQPAAAEAEVSSDRLWNDAGPRHEFAATQRDRVAAQPWVQPAQSRVFRLDAPRMRATLHAAPMLDHGRPPGGPALAQNAAGVSVTVPMPDGTYQRLRAFESSIMEPPLAAKFPEIRTYVGYGMDDPATSARLDFTPQGFHAQVFTPSGDVYIDPYWKNDTGTYSSYYGRQQEGEAWKCEVLPGAPAAQNRALAAVEPLSTGGSLRTYRLACACTGEYTAFYGGTVSGAMSGITTSVNRVVGIYERELSINMLLVANNDQIVYTKASQDPYNNNNGNTMLGQNQNTLDSVIGSANYDIGHVFSTGGGGIAYLGVVCNNTLKAGGVTGRSAPVGDAFDVDYVAHEMGHQFGGPHTFNSTTSSCGGGNRDASAAYEPGSGSTIMAYAGICGTDNLQPNSDAMFHWSSIRDIVAYVNTASCAVTSPASNNAPTANAGPDYTIPAQTPFELTATGSDPNTDPITFCWEEMDLGPATTLAAADNGSSPLFRSFLGTASGTRTFPKLSALLANTTSLGEKLPTTNRLLKFRCTVRDNIAPAGATNNDDVQLTVVNTGSAFQITSPNTAVSWWGNQTVTWNVAGTTGGGINAGNVNILLSTDGGNTFSTVLVANTPNDGSQAVTLPNIGTTTARIKVQPVGNIFFDISNVNFTIVYQQPVKPDFDGDGDVDAADYLHFEQCLKGSDIVPSAECADAQLDGDNDVDMSDFAILQRCLSGAGIAPIPTCDD